MWCISDSGISVSLITKHSYHNNDSMRIFLNISSVILRGGLDLAAAQSSIFGSARNFFGSLCRLAGSSRKLRLNSNHAPKVNARDY